MRPVRSVFPLPQGRTRYWDMALLGYANAGANAGGCEHRRGRGPRYAAPGDSLNTACFHTSIFLSILEKA
jgi:hypothetical protein